MFLTIPNAQAIPKLMDNYAKIKSVSQGQVNYGGNKPPKFLIAWDFHTDGLDFGSWHHYAIYPFENKVSKLVTVKVQSFCNILVK